MTDATDSPIPRVSPHEDGNPADDLRADVVKDIKHEHTITSDHVGSRSDSSGGEEEDDGAPR